MRRICKRTCLALVLLAAASGRAPAAKGERPEPPAPLASGSKAGPPTRLDSKPEPKDDSEPPPAPLLPETEPPEPPPAPLLPETEPPEPPPAPLLTPEQGPLQGGAPSGPSRPADTRAAQQQLRGAAWGGVAATLALLTAGTVLGVLTQQRSDALSVSTTQLSGGLPPIYDAAQQAAYLDLQSQGRTFNDATIACFAVGGALALTSGVLFWNAARLKNKSKQLALQLGGLSVRPAIELLRGPPIRPMADRPMADRPVAGLWTLAGGSVLLRGSF